MQCLLTSRLNKILQDLVSPIKVIRQGHGHCYWNDGHSWSIILSRNHVRVHTVTTVVAGGLRLLQCDTALHSSNNRLMMKAR